MADTKSILLLILYGSYYITIAVLAIFSLFGVYLLAAHGRTRLLSLIISLTFIVFFLVMLGVTQATLSSIK